jgi:hypothetical protein
MKILPLLLGVSVVANASLLVVQYRGEDLEDRAGEKAAARNTGSAPRMATMPGGPATGEDKAIVDALRLGEVERLRDELRAAGFDEDAVRSIVGVRIWKRYESRMRALQAGAGNQNQEWWKNSGNGWGGQTKEQRAAMKALQAEMKAESERVLGKDPNALANNPWLERQYGFLPQEKREALQQLEQDYNELSHELQQETQGFALPSDREKTRFLMEEKRRDLQALLSPEEFEAYELRQSRTAQNLRWQMTQMDATEAEFRAIFELRKEFDDVFNEYDQFGNRTRTMGPDDWKARSEAEKAMKAQLKDVLGAERYLDYIRAQEGDYQQLRKATTRFGLPADTPAKVYALRDEVPAAALRIADDPALSVEEKKAEVAKLAANARERVQGLLGAEVTQAFFEQNNLQWLQQLEKGSIITFDENGGQQHRRIDQPARRPAGAK